VEHGKQKENSSDTEEIDPMHLYLHSDADFDGDEDIELLIRQLDNDIQPYSSSNASARNS
jgi:hypothetical protein